MNTTEGKIKGINPFTNSTLQLIYKVLDGVTRQDKLFQLTSRLLILEDRSGPDPVANVH